MEDIATIYESFKSITKHPEKFLEIQNEKVKTIQKDLLECIYGFNRDKNGNKKSKSLPKLITKGFIDDENLWQQVELWNEEQFQENLKQVSRFLAVDSSNFQLDDLQDSENEEEQSENENQLSDDDEDDKIGSEDPEASEEDEDEEDAKPNQKIQNKRKGKASVVDDKFFKLSEMEEFLIDQDRREMNKKSSSGEDEDLIDYFADDNDEINLSESLRYSDFFDPTEEGEEATEEKDDDGPKSSFELKQERLKNKIAKMEDSMLENKAWQMKGEVRGESRPQNSLLENTLEFESTTRPAPIITEKVTLKLEDIIKQRIKDKAFDDVERKVKPSDIQYEYKKQLVLDQEKSKQSLAQVYEKEYLKELEKSNPNAADQEEEEPKEHKEIRSLLKDLFEKLDLLSNFHYTPRPAQPELKIITNLPSIAMEEVAPIAVGNATLLAPEEIKAKPVGGNIIGVSERTETDKKRERRHKKEFQRKKFMKEKLSNKGDLMSKVVKSKNVEKMKETTDNRDIKSSSAFFNKLQDDITLSKNVQNSKKRRLEKVNYQAKKLKL